MPNKYNARAGMYTCATCGGEFFIPDIEDWAFKKYKTKKNNVTKTFYFCKWSCMRAWQRIHQPEKKRKEDWMY